MGNKNQFETEPASVMLESARSTMQAQEACIKRCKNQIAILKAEIEAKDLKIMKLKSRIYDLVYDQDYAPFDDVLPENNIEDI